MRRMIDIAVTDLPQPDSPTTPRRSPAFTLKETPSTAFTTPSSVEKYVLRSSTLSKGSATFLLSLDGLRRV